MLEIEQTLQKLEGEGEKIIRFFESQISKLNTGRANPRIIGEIKVNYYDNPTPIEQVASLNLISPLQIGVKPYESSLLKEIERTLVDSNLPITVSSDSTIVRVSFPPMTTERRKEMVKNLNNLTEQAKISLRQIRSKLNKDVKSLVASEEEQRKYLNKIQDRINKLVDKVQTISQKREDELLKI